MRFELTRAEPNGLAVHRLNHSATLSSVYQEKIYPSRLYLSSLNKNVKMIFIAHDRKKTSAAVFQIYSSNQTVDQQRI